MTGEGAGSKTTTVDMGEPGESVRVPLRPQSNFFFSPNSKWLRFWQSFVAFSVIVTFVLDTFLWTFDSRSTGAWVITYLLDVVYIAHIVSRFFVGFYRNGILISDGPSMRSHYLKTTFIVDILTLMPIELAAFSPAFSAVLHGDVIVLMKYLAIFRCNRLLRLYYVFLHFDTLESRLGTDTKKLMSMKYLTIAGLAVHILACIWYMFGCPGKHDGIEITCGASSWALTFDLGTNIEVASALDSYIISLYWAVTTATSTGYGDLHPVTIGEKWFAIVAMLLGITVFFGVILGGIASVMTNMDTERARYTHRLNVIKDYLNDGNIPKDMQQQVMGYYEYLWIRKKGVTDAGLMNSLPMTFHAEVSHSANKYILNKAPMFQDLSPGFLRMLSLELKPALYLPHQIIANHNEMSHCLYYVERGELEVLSADDDDTNIMTLRCGSLFGEMSLVLGTPRSNSIRAAAHCDLMQLDKADLGNVIAHYPGVGKHLQHIAEARCTIANELENEIRANIAEKSHTTIDIAPSVQESFEESKSDHFLKEPVYVAVTHPSVYARVTRQVSRWWQELRNFDFIFMPDSTLIHCWEYLMIMVILVIGFLYPFTASFVANQHDVASQKGTLYTIMFIMDFLVFFDIVIRIRTAHVTPNGTYKDFKSIRVNYIQTPGFVLDILAALPLELFSLIFVSGPIRTSYVYMLSLNRIIKFWRIPDFFNKKQRDLHVDIGNLRFFKFLIYISILSHWSACIWYLGLHSQGRNEEYAHQNHEETIPIREYLIALYWAGATMTSTGYGDITPHSKVSYIITVVTEIGGLLLFGYCLSAIAATLANSDASRVNFLEKLTAVKQFMKDHHLGTGIQERVTNYMNIVFQKNKGEEIPGGQRLMHDMPNQLQQDVAYFEAKDTLVKCPLFQDCDEYFLRRLALKTHVFLYSPGDTIVTRGDQGREMYFIKKGTCEIVSKDRTRSMSRIGAGHYFGEVGLLFGDYRTVTVVAVSHCEMMMLKHPDLLEVLQDFPLIARQFKEVSENKEYLAALKETAEIQELSYGHARNIKDITDETIATAAKCMKVFTDTEKADYKVPFERLSFIPRQLAKFLMPKVFLPTGFNVKFWEGSRVFIAILIALFILVQAAFVHMCIHLWVICFVLDLMCFVDLYLKFHYAYYNDQKLLVTHPLETAKNYLRTNFLLDLLACFPTELIAYCILQSFTPDAIHIYAVVRLNRLLQLYRVPLAFNFMESDGKYDTGSIREGKFFIYLVVFFHALTCLWYFNACPPLFMADPTADDIQGLIATNYHYCSNASWTVRHAGFFDEDIVGQYIVSMYWAAATGASVGYGDISATPDNYPEMLIATVCMIGGIVFFGYIIASVAASLSNADAQRARFQEKVMSVERYLKVKNVEKTLAERVTHHFNYMWLRTQGIDPDSLFDGLTLSLKADVSVSLYAEMINKVPLFQGTDEGFQKMLAVCIKPVYYMANEYVVRRGDHGENMFFIHRGSVDVVSECATKIFDTMNPGRFFGEVSLITNSDRTASIRCSSQGNCDMFILEKKDLDDVLKLYPSIKEQIDEVAQERVRAVEARRQAEVAANLAKAQAKAQEESTEAVETDQKSDNSNQNAEDYQSRSQSCSPVPSETGRVVSPVRPASAERVVSPVRPISRHGSIEIDRPVALSRPGSADRAISPMQPASQERLVSPVRPISSNGSIEIDRPVALSRPGSAGRVISLVRAFSADRVVSPVRPASAERVVSPVRPISSNGSIEIDRPVALSRPGSAGRVISLVRAFSADRVVSPVRPASAERVVSPVRPGSADRVISPVRPISSHGSIEIDRPVALSRPGSADRVISPVRPASAERVVSPVRPASAERVVSPVRPGSAERIISPVRPISSHGSIEIDRPVALSRPGSAERVTSPVRPVSTERAFSAERPISAERSVSPVRPTSAQSISSVTSSVQMTYHVPASNLITTLAQIETPPAAALAVPDKEESLHQQEMQKKSADFVAVIMDTDEAVEQQDNEETSDSNKNNNGDGETETEGATVEITASIPFWQRLLALNRFVLAPTSLHLRILSDITCALIFLTTLAIVFQAAYQYESTWIVVFSYLCEIVFIYEIYIKFHVSCSDEYGELEMNFGKVYRMYLKNPFGFPVDLAATLPFEIFAVFFDDSVMFAVFSFLRLTRLIRLIRLEQFFSKWEKELNINMLKVRLIKFSVFVILIIHFCASIWYMIACPLGNCKAGTWAAVQGYQDGRIAPVSERATDSIYWCVATLTSTGYGDIHAYTRLEMVFASFVMVLGQLLVGSVLGNIASTLANRDTMRVDFEKQLDAVKAQMAGCSKELKERIIDYFDYLWMRNKGVDQHELFKDAPFCLQTELALHVNGHHLDNLEIFKGCSAAFIRHISLSLREVLFKPGDDLVDEGDMGSCMFFIHKGMAQVMQERDPTQVEEILYEGQHFDDMHLLYDIPREHTITAVTHVDTLTLSIDDLNQILEYFPDDAEIVRANGISRFGSIAKRMGAGAIQI